VAGIFAFSPIEQASTVHNTILTTQINNVEASQTNCSAGLQSNTLIVTSDRDFLFNLVVSNDAGGGGTTITINNGTFLNNFAISDGNTFSVTHAFAGGTTITISADGDDIDGCVSVITESGGDSSIT